MQPLIFLTTRSLINGIRRAFTSGRRLITLIFVILYYGYLVFRPLGASNTSFANSRALQPLSPATVHAVIFTIFAFMSLLLFLPNIAQQSGFGQADVDVLFATPVNPRKVLLYRLLRNYLGALITPLFLLIFSGKAGISVAGRFMLGLHGNGPQASQVLAIAWFLTAFAWVCVGNGVGFLINRSDLAADRNKKIVDRTIFGSLIACVLYIGVRFALKPDAATYLDCIQSPLPAIVMFSGTAACWMVEGALHGQILYMLLGTGVFISLAAFGIWLAFSQVPFMYDQAAAKGFGSSERRLLQRNNDMYGLSAQRAREGKSKISRLSRWFGRLHFSGASVLIWKEILLQLRSNPFLYILMGSMQLIMVVLPVIAIDSTSSRTAIWAIEGVIFGTQGISVLMLTMNNAVSGFIELLKRIDFQKPLPFRPAGTVFWEVLSKCFPNIVHGSVAALIVIALKPFLWSAAIGSVLFVVGLSLVVSATVFLVTISFSDAGDASQRGFRGILILIGMVIAGSPGVGVLILLLGVLRINPLLAAIPATLINIAVALLISYIAGGLYDSYNPNE